MDQMSHARPATKSEDCSSGDLHQVTSVVATFRLDARVASFSVWGQDGTEAEAVTAGSGYDLHWRHTRASGPYSASGRGAHPQPAYVYLRS